MIKIFLISFFLSFNAHAQKFEVPALTAPVIDNAELVDPHTTEALNRVLRELHDSGGSQINVLTVPTLNGIPLEEATIAVTDQWKLGSKKEDNGVLLFIALQERKIRIEVGQGLEGVLPDVIAGRIIRNDITPLMKQGRTSDAILNGVISIVEHTDPKFDFGSRLEIPRERSTQNDDKGGSLLIFGLILAIFLLKIFLIPRRYGYGSGWWGGGGFGGGGFGGGGFGGGGSWGGGGGGFSGGGASGGW